MEACGSAHYWARRFQSAGHQVKLIAPQYVKPFVIGNKSDRIDAKAIAEVAVRASTPSVAVKSDEHLDLQAIHRVRERLVRSRTAVCNEIRGLLFEHGICLSQGMRALRLAIAGISDGSLYPELSQSCRITVTDLYEELLDTDDRIKRNEQRLEHFAKDSEACQRLQSIPGIGLITATALVAATPNPGCFKNGRQFAAWIGLVPRHSGTGGAHKNKLGRISKRGDPYLRRLLVHGGRAAIQYVDRRDDAAAQWIRRLKDKKGWNRACVALANKNARVAWALLNSNATYDSKKVSKAS
ncbi:MAG: IS110 family transposase [Pseudobdellovibrionaceae bacterium]|nr:IS110 family transposase [Pseudobdellovibrionaceae bacterium]